MSKIFVFTISTILPLLTRSQVLNDRCTTAAKIPANVTLPYVKITSNASIPNDYPYIPINNPTASCVSPEFRDSFWYYWEPSQTTLIDISYSGWTKERFFQEIVPAVAVYEGSECQSLKELACHDELLKLPSFQVVARKKYVVALFFNYWLPADKVNFQISKTPRIPRNDECKDALVIPSQISFPYSTRPVIMTRATTNITDPVSKCGQNLNAFDDLDYYSNESIETVWYSWVPSISGMYDFRTNKSRLPFGRIGLNIAIEIYKGRLCDSVLEVTCNQNDLDVRGVKLDAGERYFVKVATRRGDLGGSVILTVNPTKTNPPKNDNCQNASSIDVLNGRLIRGDTFSATSENIKKDGCGGNPGLWYRLKVRRPMIIDVSTCSKGTTYDSRISIYSGNDCNKLKCVTYNDRGYYDERCGDLLSKVNFLAKDPATYYLLIHGTGSHRGSFELTVVGNPNVFSLIDSTTDKTIELIKGGEDFSYDYLSPSSMLNIQANFEKSVKSAFITFDNPHRSFCESNAPFTVFGKNQTDYFGVYIPLGAHNVTATPYNQANCAGLAGPTISKIVSFNNDFYYGY